MLDEDALADIDGDSSAIYSLAGADPADPPSIGIVVGRVLGTPIRFASIRTEAELSFINGEAQIRVRRGTRPARARWLAGHELAEWWYAKNGYRGEDIEERCDALGAALIAPRPAFLLALRSWGDEPAMLAEAFRTTQSLAALRIGECVGTPVVLVGPSRSIVRGEPFGWPNEAELRRVAREGHPALRCIPVTDEPKRTVLMAAA